jgi:opacity protein-like surface antigen
MKKLLIFAGIATLVATAPAFADPGKGHGNKGNKGHGYAYGGGGCPPGLAKKNNGCLPPGQAKKLYNVGQHWPGHYGYAWNYNQIPYDMRMRYAFNPNYRYYYGDGYVYQVDPATMLVSQVVSAILR